MNIKTILKSIIPKKYHKSLSQLKIEIFDGYALKSYSQEGEDMVLGRLFEKQKNGFYVDVGAHHPKRFSNTYYFYKRGWRGINIDAMPGSMKSFEKFRGKDINVEAAISNTDNVLTFYIFNEPALNGFSKEISELRNKGNYKIVKEMEIKTKRLESVLDSSINRKQQIDFMSIDVEGLDLDVLRSNNWEKYRPKIVLVEILGSNIDELTDNEITKFMWSNDYTIYAKTVNTVFFRDRRLLNV